MRLWTIVLTGLLVLTACSDNTGREGSILPADLQLQEGDVVFRRGGGFTSHAVLMADRGGIYSHVGIVADSAGQLMVVHAVPGEPDYEGDEDRVKMDCPASRCRLQTHRQPSCPSGRTSGNGYIQTSGAVRPRL